MVIKFILENLDCAHCAAEVEKELNKLEIIEQANINFALKQLTVRCDDGVAVKNLKETIERKIKTIETDVKVVMIGRAKLDMEKVNEKSDCEKQDCSCGHNDSIHSMDSAYHSVKTINNSSVVVDIKKQNRLNDLISKLKSKEGIKFSLIIIGIIILIPALLVDMNKYLRLGLCIISYISIGWEVIWNSLRNIRRGKIFDENFLMMIATIGAFVLFEFLEGIAVLLFYEIGEYFQDKAVKKSRKALSDMLDIRPEYANLSVDNTIKQVDPYDVKIDDVIIIKAGERVPLDGTVISGESFLDTVALTGESVPEKIKVGDKILSGSINMNGILKVKVTEAYENSTVSRILEVVENASSRKAVTENFITKFAKYYTPLVVLCAVLIAVLPPLITGAAFGEWLYPALVFLMVSCPCALVISIPLSYFGGIGAAGKLGVLVKGGNYLEALAKVDKVVFDKTGTLTKGVFNVQEIRNIDIDADEFLHIVAELENYSNHPIAASITKAYNGKLGVLRIENYTEHAGLGISGNIDGKEVLIGKEKLLTSNNIKVTDKSDSVGSVVYVAIDNVYKGYIVVADEIKEDSYQTIKDLHNKGVKEIVMLTGDNRAAAESVAEKLGIDKVYSQLLPTDKVDRLEEIMKDKGSVTAFVGDGINDAPVLARADVGIAMGGIGSSSASEVADIVLMTDEPSKIPTAIKVAKFTKKIVFMNIALALTVKLAVMILGALSIATMWEAVIADVGVSILAILNSLRILKKKY